MFYAKDGEVAERNKIVRVRPGGLTTYRREYFGPPPSHPAGSPLIGPYVDPAPGEVREPQAFIVEQEPGTVIDPHFHFVDQFQVVVEGSGTIGRHAVAPYSLHFSTACTGYGPITPGAEGIKYLTVRASADSTGAQYLPAARPLQKPTPKRNLIIDDLARGAVVEGAAVAEIAVQTFAEEESGLAVMLLRLPAGAEGSAAPAVRGIGQTLVVLEGSVVHGGQPYTRLSVMYASADETPVRLRGGADGAAVLVLQYPHPAHAVPRH